MKNAILKVLSLAIVLSMLLAMGTVVAFATEPAEQISAGMYPYPYPLAGDAQYYWGWNQQPNKLNSVWYNETSETYPVTEPTDGYYEGWSSSNPVTTGTHHPYGIGMHSAIKYAPSVVYDINTLKITRFETTVFLVQYDMADEEGMIDIEPTEEERVPIVVYLDVRASGATTWGTEQEDGTVKYYKEVELTEKGEGVKITLNSVDLKGMKEIRMGIKTMHGIYEVDEETGTETLIDNTAMASVYFADLYIEQSGKVEIPDYPSSVPARPDADAEPEQATEDVYTVIKAPEADENNWLGKPYGPWKAGENDLYYLSNMTYKFSSNTPNTANPFGQPTTVNKPYSTADGTPFMFGAEGMEHEYTNGISMHPKNPKQPVFGRTDSWTVYDISAYTAEDSETPADTFYALVGLITRKDNWGSRLSSAGVYVYIYGDRTGDGDNYELLAASELVKGYRLGEFNVNIEGVKLLLIDVVLPEDATSHGYSGVGFGDACLFLAADPATVSRPDYSGDYVPDDCWNNIHVYGDNEWLPHSDTKHKQMCDCGTETIYEDHTWSIDQSVKPSSTCTSTTTKTYTCLSCGFQKTEIFTTSEHHYGNWEFYSDTQHEKTCDCGKETLYENHRWDEGVITSVASHESPAIKTYTCHDCNAQRTEVLGEKTPHTWSAVWIIESETQHKHRCACGAIEYFDHVYDDEKDRFCNDCGYQRAISDSSETETNNALKPEATTSPETQAETTSMSEIEKTLKEFLPGCESTLTVGAGLTLLLSIGSAGLIFKKRKD